MSKFLFFLLVFLSFSFKEYHGHLAFTETDITYTVPFSFESISYDLEKINLLIRKNKSISKEYITLNKINYNLFFRKCRLKESNLARFDHMINESDLICSNEIDLDKRNSYKRYYSKNILRLKHNNNFYLSYFEYVTNKSHYYYEVFIDLNHKIMFYSILEKSNHKIGNNYIKFLYPIMKFLNQFKIIPIINKNNYNKELKNFKYFPEDPFYINKEYYKISFSFINYDKIWKIKNNISLFISIDSKKSFILTHKTFIRR